MEVDARHRREQAGEKNQHRKALQLVEVFANVSCVSYAAAGGSTVDVVVVVVVVVVVFVFVGVVVVVVYVVVISMVAIKVCLFVS